MNSRAVLAEFAHGLETILASVKHMLEEDDSPNDWVDQRTSPLGRRRHCELSKRGKLPGAHKVNGYWLVRRKDIDAYIEKHEAPEVVGDEAEQAAILAFRAPAKGSRKSKR